MNDEFIVTEQDLRKGKILLIDKPEGWTSFDVVGKIRSVLRKKFDRKNIKVGHGGTLDPLATGLLLIGIGPATKLLQSIQQADKTYEGIIRLGAVTPSYDRETPPEDFKPYEHITREQISEVFARFMGPQLQLPPVFSAVRKGGKRLYELARKGQTDVPVEPRPVHIHRLELLDFTPPEVHFRTRVSKGTYIRSLAHDIGQALGCGGYLAGLRRTHIGRFSVDNAIAPDRWMELNI